MRISILLALMLGVLVCGGVGEKTLRCFNISRRNALFFLLCTVVLDRFTIYPNDETGISAACLMFCVWLFGFAFTPREKTASALLTLPVSIVLGFLCSRLTSTGRELALYIAAAVFGLASIPRGLPFGFAVCAMAPIFALFFYYAAVPSSRVMGLFLTEDCLIMQLSGLFFSTLYFIAIRSIFKMIPVKA